MKFIKILSFALVIALLFCSIVGCNKDQIKEENGYPVTVGGAEITKSPKKVVALSEQAASAICALGYKSYLVGAPSEFFETQIDGIADIGPWTDLDFEKIYELTPDVLIAPGELEETIKENVIARNIKIVLLKTPTKYDEVAPYYEALSKLFLGEEKYMEAYDPYIGETERIISDTAEALKGVKTKVALFVEEGFVATGDTIAGGAMAKAGFNNIAENHTDYLMSFRDIKAADPEVIFCPAGYTDIIIGSGIYKDLTAVKKGAVYEVDIAALVYATEGFAATLQSMSKYLLQ